MSHKLVYALNISIWKYLRGFLWPLDRLECFFLIYRYLQTENASSTKIPRIGNLQHYVMKG